MYSLSPSNIVSTWLGSRTETFPSKSSLSIMAILAPNLDSTFEMGHPSMPCSAFTSAEIDITSGTFGITWNVPGTNLVNVDEITITLDYSCTPHGNLTINRWVPEHEGYLTTGDNPDTNGCTIDQLRATSPDADDDYIRSRGLKDENGNPVTAVRGDWIIGVASSEIPWVGAIKLFFSGTSSFVSGQTWNNLFSLIAIVVIVPMIFDLYLYSNNDEEE